MPKPDHAAPYDPDLAPAFEQQLDERAQALRQALLPLREFTQRRYASIHHVPAAKQPAYHRDTQALEAIPEAVYAFSLAVNHLVAALWQEVLAAEAGTGLREAQRDAGRGQLFERLFGVLLSVVEFPAEALPPHIRKMQAFADRMSARYPHGLRPLPKGWDAPLLAKQLREPHRADEPSPVVPIPPRNAAA